MSGPFTFIEVRSYGQTLDAIYLLENTACVIFWNVHCFIDRVQSEIRDDCQQSENVAEISQQRRRLLHTAMGVGPVVLTLASQPVLGQVVCVSASATTSLNVSGVTRTASMCSGLSPDAWKAQSSTWPAPYLAGTAATGPQPDSALGTGAPCVSTASNAETSPAVPDNIPSYAVPYYRRLGRLPARAASTPTPSCTGTTTTVTPSTASLPGNVPAYAMPYYQRLGRLPGTATTTTTTTLSRPSSSVQTPSSASNIPSYAVPYYQRLGRLPTTTSPTSPPPTTLPPSLSGAAPTNPPDGTLYHCSTTGLGGSVYSHHTMLEVLETADGVGPYFVAALLNARSGRTPVLTETNIRQMWNDVVNLGYYEPAAGIRWTASNVVTYIKTTIG